MASSKGAGTMHGLDTPEPGPSLVSTPGLENTPFELTTFDADAEQATQPLTPVLPLEESAKAWLSVIGAFLFLFPTFGVMQTIGTLQAYMEHNQLSAYSTRDVGWITGVFTSLAMFLGIQVGPLFDAYGPKLLGPIGCAIYIPVFFVLAECREYWHFMLVLGIWGGLGAAILSMVAVAVVGKWFVRRRGLAMGIALCGSSVAGVVLPLMLRSLLPRLGWAWAIRILAFVLAAVMITGALCLQMPMPKPQISPAAEDRRRKKVALNFMALTSGTFTLVTVGLFALEFAIFGVFSLLPTYATASNFPADSGFVMVAVANAMSTVGRLLPGLAGDHFGHFNVLLAMILTTVIFTGAILVPFGSTSLGALYAFSALWGFGSGSFMSLTPVCMGKTCETEDFGRYFGTMYFFVSFSLLLASPLSGQMLQTFGTRALACLYMSVVAAGGIAFLLARQLLHGKRGLQLKERI